jgi:hypothetical protein
MDESPETLRELAQYLRNASRLFPSPRAIKAYEWMTIKASEADDHAAAWDADRKRLRALRQMYQEHTAIEDWEIDAILADYISAQEAADGD